MCYLFTVALFFSGSIFLVPSPLAGKACPEGRSSFDKLRTNGIERFPDDFMLQLTKDEFENLIFHFGTSSWGGTRKLPRVFTKNGVAMLSSVLNGNRAIQVNIQTIRAFTKLREMLSAHKDLQKKIDEMEKKYDHQFKIVFDAIRQLLEPPQRKKRKIGF